MAPPARRQQEQQGQQQYSWRRATTSGSSTSSTSSRRTRRSIGAVAAAAVSVMLPLLLLAGSPWRARAFQLLAPSSRRTFGSDSSRLLIDAAQRRHPAASAALPRAAALWAARRAGPGPGAGAGKGKGEGKQEGGGPEEDGQQGPGAGRGPRNRQRAVNNPSDEEEFAALSSAGPPSGGDGQDGDGGGSRPAGGARRIVKITRPTERPRKAPLSVNPNWSPKGGAGRRAPAPAPAPAARAPVTAAAAGAGAVGMGRGARSRGAAEDDGDDVLLDVPEGLKVRALDSKAYEEARRLAGLDDDDDDEDDDMEKEMDDEDEDEGEYDSEWEEDEDEGFDDDDDDDEELDLPPRPPAGAQLSMAERLKMAQSGTIYNPYVMAAHARPKTTLAGADGRQRGGGGDLDEEGEFGFGDGDDEEEDDGLAAAGAGKGGRGKPPKKAQPLKYQYKIVMDVGTCPGCGNSFQTRNDSAPGFVPVDVYQRLQARLMTSRRPPKQQQPQQGKKPKLVVMAEGEGEGEEDLYQGLSPDEEVELLLSGKDRAEWEQERASASASASVVEDDEEGDLEEEEEGAEEEEEERMVICQRCHKLKHYGEVEDALRPGWSDNEALTPERFKDLLSVVRKKRCAVVCLVDVFDFHGSLLYNLPRVVGDNPVLVAVNKADLLPSDVSEERVRVWVKQEMEKIGMKDVSTRDVHLVSCKTGHGVKPLLRAMKTLARTRKRDLYVIGAANVGKSTFINRLIELGRTGGAKPGGGAGSKGKGKGKGGDAGKKGTLVTTSPLPGTTLNFIEVDLGDKVSLYDTPGLILKHQITTLLTTEELKAVIPQKRINHVTLRLKEGKSVLLGGLARLDMVEGRPFLFTFYVSNDVKLHQTATDRADDFLHKHVGELVFPPYSEARLEELGPWVPREFEIEGGGWKTSVVDIVISGLGWISVTGALGCKVRVMAPESVGVRLRNPLMPYETWDTTAKWTGLRAVKTGKKGGSR